MRYHFARWLLKIAMQLEHKRALMVFPDGTWVLPAKGITVTYRSTRPAPLAVFRSNRVA